MTRIEIRTLGEFTVLRDAAAIKLPASRRTRALLAFLALTARPHRRDRLCELLWEIPDDPRGALRWSLSKIRPLVNDPECERLVADRERVALRCADIELDVRGIDDALEAPGATLAQLERLAEALTERFRNAGIAWSPRARVPLQATEPADPTTARQFLARQKIQFCSAADTVWRLPRGLAYRRHRRGDSRARGGHDAHCYRLGAG